MVYLGWILRLALVVMLLPWAAYFGAAAKPVSDTGAGLLHTLQPTAPGTEAAAASAETSATDRLLPQPRRCKTGILAGARCAPDAALSGNVALAAPAGQPVIGTAGVRSTSAARTEAPPRRPPRLPPFTA